VIFIVAPAPYVPFVVDEVKEVIVGRVVSKVKTSDVEFRVPAFPAESRTSNLKG
jgi:hypothetical protein